ncbi:MAG: tetratricopeptide repeat protein [Treponema sp.]
MKEITGCLKKVSHYSIGLLIIGGIILFLYQVPGKKLYKSVYNLICIDKIEKAQIEYTEGKKYFFEKNFSKATVYLTKSMEDGNIDAQVLLAIVYMAENTQQDRVKVLDLLFSAEKREKSKLTEYLIGFAYLMNDTDQKNVEKAFHWFYKSSKAGFLNSLLSKYKQGNPLAQYQLALLYQSGNGTKKDSLKAKKWFLRCGNTAYQEGMNFIGNDDMDNALNMFKLGAESGNAEAQCMLGLWYLYGRNITIDYKKAYDLLTQSVSQMKKNPAAYRGLGEIYINGYGIVNKDPKKGLEYLKMAADQGDTDAKRMLGSNK